MSRRSGDAFLFRAAVGVALSAALLGCGGGREMMAHHHAILSCPSGCSQREDEARP